MFFTWLINHMLSKFIAPSMFTTNVAQRREAKNLQEEKESLQQLIGKQAIELEWLKKSWIVRFGNTERAHRALSS